MPADGGTGQARSYEVKKGDSLAAIAHQFKPAGVSLDQMLVVLYQANPEAFVGNNMNRLRSGQVLSVPDAQAAADVAPAEARSIVVAQTRDFNEYRNRLAGQVAAGPAKPAAASRQSAAGKVTSTVQEPAGAAGEAKDKLTLSKVGGGGSAGGPAAASTEDLIAKDKALADANARVQELEKNLADLQKLLEIKNKSLAGQQQAVATSAAAAPAAAAAVEAPAAQPAAADKDSAQQEPVPAGASAAVASAEKPAAPVKRPPAPAPVVEEPSFIDSLLDNALLLPGAGLLLVALGAFGIYSSRKKKQKSFSDSILADSSLKANSLFGSTGGQSVDTNNSVFNSSYSPSASHLDTNEVDPVAEADVYIAYGRDAQAEEILKEALRTQPERNPVRLKLLEIYANRKDLRAFELLASELYAMTKGAGDEWRQAATLGLTIDPTNPLYAGGKLDDEAAAKAAVMIAPTEPLEELDLDALLAATQPHSVMPEPDLPEAAPSHEPEPFEDAPVIPAASVAAPSVEQTAIADLDFDLGDFGKEMETAPAEIPAQVEVTAEAPSAEAPALDFGVIDFNLDAAPAMASTDNGADLPPPAEDSVQVAESELEALPEMSASPAVAASPAFDLEGIDLDLGHDGAAEGGDPYSVEMSTKLDLALAYREIGDREGARELLDEVVKSGSQQQAERAKSLLAELA